MYLGQSQCCPRIPGVDTDASAAIDRCVAMTGCKKEDIEVCVASSGNACSGGIIPCCFCSDYTSVLVLTIGGDLIYSTTYKSRTTKCPLIDARGKSMIEVSIGPNAIMFEQFTPFMSAANRGVMRPVRVGGLSGLPTGLSAQLKDIIEAKSANQADGLEAIVPAATVVVPVMVMERGVGGGREKSLGDQIKELQELHAQGVLTDKEFADAKAKVINGGS